MSELEVVEVGRADTEALRAWLEVTAAAERHEIGDHAPLWTYDELLHVLGTEGGMRRTRLFAGLLDGEVVAAGRLSLTMGEGVDGAEVHPAVRPDVRRRGIGSALLAGLEAAAAGEGRSRLEAQPHWPYEGPVDGAGTAGVEFARAHGYTFGIGEVQRELDLPVDTDLLRELAAESAPYHRDYELRSWSGAIPDELVLGWLELSSTLGTEAPAGDMERDEEPVDVAALRETEAVQDAQGRTPWHTVALDPTGEVVAYTQLIETMPDNPFLFQWGTLVHRAHRGHRLGTAVKVANHRALQEGADVDGRRVITWNAEMNDHMIGINERLGFVTAARSAEMQKRLPARRDG